MKRTVGVVLASALFLGVAACGTGTGGEDRLLGTASEPQLDYDNADYLLYTLTQSGRQVGQVLVTGTAFGAYAASTEYWYMTAVVEPSADLTFTSGSPGSWSSPPRGLGTLSFRMDQQATWQADCGARGSHFVYDVSGSPRYLIGWDMTASDGAWSGEIVWYNTTASNVFGASQTNAGAYGSYAPTGWYCYVAHPL